MGNCLKSPTSDDISLLHESQSDRASYGDGTEPDQEPPPPYQVLREIEKDPVPVGARKRMKFSEGKVSNGVTELIGCNKG